MRWLILLLLGLLLLPGCGRGRTAPPAPPKISGSSIGFTDAAGTAGVDFALGYGGRSPLTILQTSPGGAAFLDFNGDGEVDILLVGPQRVGLWRNRGDLSSPGGPHFDDVTAGSGLDAGHNWMGCAAADYDGDGRVDILLTGHNRTALYRNRDGLGRFTDVTDSAGIQRAGWTLSGAFADYDRDGLPDLYVTRFLRFSPDTLQLCRMGSLESTCGPEVYEPQAGTLYRNIGGGRFRDVTRSAGAVTPNGKSWSALFSDFNEDGYPDLYLANDMTPCDLFTNRRGRFASEADRAGVAFGGGGQLQGAMGVDSGDYNRDGRFDLLVTTYFAQPTSLYENEGGGFFKEVGTAAGLGPPTQRYVGFGTGFIDADNDGWLDVFIANGHVRDNVKRHDPSQSYPQPMQILRYDGQSFHDVSSGAGPPFGTPMVGRGAAFGDYDRDGRLDILVANLNGKARLLHNESERGNHWLRVRLKGLPENHQGLGARVEIRHGAARQVREIRTCGSVLSSHEPVAHFGLGQDLSVSRLHVTWPDGKTTTIAEPISADQLVRIGHPYLAAGYQKDPATLPGSSPGIPKTSGRKSGER